MTKTITVIGIDPSLRNFGLALAKLNVEDNSFEVYDLILASTEIDKTKAKTVRKNSQDLERARALHHAVCKVLKEHRPAYAFVEVPHGSQSARSMASYGICIGLLSALPIRMIEVTAGENKVKATSHKTASKEEMIEWATKKFPNAPWLTRTVKGQKVLVEKNEHLADACGAINAGIDTEEWRNIATVFSIMS